MAPDQPPDPRLTPDTSWRPQYHFAAAVRPEFAHLYRPLMAGRYYPVAQRHPTKPSRGIVDHWLKPSANPDTWVLVVHEHNDFIQVERGDAWEGEEIQPLDYPLDPRPDP